MPMMAFRIAQPALLVDLRKLPGLKEIKIGADGVRFGALVRWRDILDDKRLKGAHPLLQEAVSHVAHYQIRNRGTVGGSLAHADPASEMPGIAQTCDAEITVIGKAGARTIKAADFFKGALTTALDPTRSSPRCICRPGPPGGATGFQDFARRRGDFAMAGVALYYDTDGGKAANGHIGVFGVGDCQRRLAESRKRAQRPCGRRGARRQGRRGGCRRGRAAGGHPRQRRLPALAHRHAHRARATGSDGKVSAMAKPHHCHSGAGRRPEPGIQTCIQSLHLDSGFALRAPRNDGRYGRCSS
jgi:CO/xanthine dehydrogenase FAD-binding subunit